MIDLPDEPYSPVDPNLPVRRDPVVTQKMIDAGVALYFGECDDGSAEDFLRQVFVAMYRASGMA